MKRESHKFDPRVFRRFLEVVSELDAELNSIEVRSLTDPKEHTDRARDRDIVGQPKSVTLSSSISEPQQEIFTLFEIFQNIGNSLSKTDTLTILASKLEKIVPFTTLVIYLVDDSSGELRPAHIGGVNKEHFTDLEIEIGTRLAGWVAANNRFLYNVHPGPDTMTLPPEVRSLYGNSLLAPLVHEERPIGTIALYVAGDDKYTDDHIRLMEIVSNRASIALFNAIRFEETQEDAFTDRLTGLPNSRFLYIFFEQTLSEAKRYGEPLTVIEMDLDDFKSVNDRHGHHTGDRFLKEVGRILKEQMRDSDVLVRYAGDEFIAVLPKTSYEQARQFSYRLQDAVEATVLDVGVGPLKVGISLGLASYPASGRTWSRCSWPRTRTCTRTKLGDGAANAASMPPPTASSRACSRRKSSTSGRADAAGIVSRSPWAASSFPASSRPYPCSWQPRSFLSCSSIGLPARFSTLMRVQPGIPRSSSTNWKSGTAWTGRCTSSTRGGFFPPPAETSAPPSCFQRPVADLLEESLPRTLALVAMALLFCAPVGPRSASAPCEGSAGPGTAASARCPRPPFGAPRHPRHPRLELRRRDGVASARRWFEPRGFRPSRWGRGADLLRHLVLPAKQSSCS